MDLDYISIDPTGWAVEDGVLKGVPASPWADLIPWEERVGAGDAAGSGQDPSTGRRDDRADKINLRPCPLNTMRWVRLRHTHGCPDQCIPPELPWLKTGTAWDRCWARSPKALPSLPRALPVPKGPGQIALLIPRGPPA